MNKRTVLCALVFILAIGGATTAAYLRLFKPIVATVLPQELVVGSSILTYPHIIGLPDQQVEDKLNSLLRQKIEAFAAWINTPQHTANTKYLVQLNKNNILSLTLSELFYVQHAAHPMSYLKAFTMNSHNGQVYQLRDLFRPDSDYAALLNRIIQEQMSARQIFLLRPFKGIHEEQEFYLTDDALVLYYQLYEYAPYVYGFLKFTIPYADLNDLMLPDIVRTLFG